MGWVGNQDGLGRVGQVKVGVGQGRSGWDGSGGVGPDRVRAG